VCSPVLAPTVDLSVRDQNRIARDAYTSLDLDEADDPTALVDRDVVICARILLGRVNDFVSFGLGVSTAQDLEYMSLTFLSMLAFNAGINLGWSPLLGAAADPEERHSLDDLAVPEEPSPLALIRCWKPLHGTTGAGSEESADNLGRNRSS
jgi:hypothetical protein